MRLLYSLILYLAVPLVLLRLQWRGFKAAAYRQRWTERFALGRHIPTGPCIWLHAVSVGEVLAAAPLIRTLLERYPNERLLITTMTPTGSQRVVEGYGDQVAHCYLPYDLPDAVQRFLARTQPRIAVIMETELWPNLFHACQRRRIPLIMANARLSQRSMQGYRRLGRLVRNTLNQTTLIACRDSTDVARFIELGAQPQRVLEMGNIKFDIKLSASLRESAQVLRRELGANRPVWIAASTHEGEEEQVLHAFVQVRHVQPDALLMLVPRHPERFDRVAALCERSGYNTVRRSVRGEVNADTAIYLGDTMGELNLLYAAADVAYVGGSLVATGGHNLLEPAALGLPVITGPQVFNFEEIHRLMREADAVITVRDADELAQRIEHLLRDGNLRAQWGERAKALVDKHRGALLRLQELIDQQMAQVHAVHPAR